MPYKQGERWTIANKDQLEAFITRTRELFQEHKIITYAKPELGRGRSLSQNALFQVWAREIAAVVFKVAPNFVDEGQHEGMKRWLKKEFYTDTGSDWMIGTMINPRTGEVKKDFRSTKKFTKGNMFFFMEWVQSYAAAKGIVLESKGEYQMLQEEQNN